MKYWRTFRPSRKFERIGVSMISPEGLAIRPRMPASCRICCAVPRAPESDMMRIGFDSLAVFSFSSIARNISLATLSVTSDQMAMTLL